MLATCLAVAEYLVKATLRQEGLFLTDSSRVQNFVAGKLEERRLRQMCPPSGSREMESGAQLTSSFYSVPDPSPWHDATPRKVGLHCG